MDTPGLSVAEKLACASKSISESISYEETAHAIVSATRSSLPEFGHVSLSLRHRNGTIETKAGTDQLVWDLDAVQYQLSEGPCVQAIEDEPVVVVAHLRHEQRWPRYVRAAAARGVRSQVAVRLFTHGRHLGGLNLYSTEQDEVCPESAETARLLATHAAIMLRHAEQEHHLNQALHSRKVIGQAIGIIMERHRIDGDSAFQFLVRVSSTNNIKVRHVADELVRSSTDLYRKGD